MKSKHVLIPLDLVRSPSDALVFVRDMATDRAVCVTLLYVLNLNIAMPDRKVQNELCAEGEAALRRLACFFFGTDRAARIVVRMGKPHEEIVDEARAQSADLIVMSGPKRRTWKNLLLPGTTQKVTDASPCPAMVLPRGCKLPALPIRTAPAVAEAELAEAV